MSILTVFALQLDTISLMSAMSVVSSDEESPLSGTDPQTKLEICAGEAALKRRNSLEKKPITRPHTLELSRAPSNEDLLLARTPSELEELPELEFPMYG